MHFDGLGNGSDLHRDIDTLARVDIHIYGGGNEFLETGEFSGDGVVADLNIEEIVAAVLVGCGFLFDAGAFVSERNGRIAKDGARRVAHGAEYFGGFKLAE